MRPGLGGGYMGKDFQTAKAVTKATQPQDLRKIRRRIEDMLRKDEVVLLKVARFLKIA